ncbi:hypothetical protein MUR26_00070 [Klebsiella pneumoniae]|uniref:phage minor tail protein domain-containing protein n=1 Tax=Klebsiella pneumoniae TaxID=573 RepID=UPI00265C49E2|nr:phage minor tail protein G [Klebsiella pneumoniae]MDO0707775.1 hypothetical protein [Klebsiella pneumoniae]
MTYLKKDTLNPDGENILLFELSAYSRMQYIEFMVEERKSLPSEESTPEENFKEGANKRGNSSRLTQSFHFFMFEPIFSPVNALNQPI